MDQNSLGNFRNDISNLSDEPEKQKAEGTASQAAMYHQEINTLKIEKLSQRITIISVIIPCIIIAILAFAYIDMKERVVDVDENQGSHVEQIARTLEEKLNALDVRIAKATFDLDEKLALIEKKSHDLENQAAKMSASKADLKSVETALAKVEKRIKDNAAQNKTTLATIERINTRLQKDIKSTNTKAQAATDSIKKFQNTSDSIKKDIHLFKEEFDARLLELSAYEQEIAALTKATGLLDKKVKTLKQDNERYTDKKLTSLQASLKKDIEGLEKQLKKNAPVKSAVPEVTLPSPVAPPVPSLPGGISEQNLTQ